MTTPRTSAQDPMTVLAALGDNLVYLYRYGPADVFAVDPGEAGCVLRALRAARVRLTHILMTHHHADHCAGAMELKRTQGCTLIGPDAGRIAGLDQEVMEGDRLRFGPVEVQVLATPGHTRTGVCYLLAGTQAPPILWTGDTLFAAGCGRLFECSEHQMWASLQRLRALPPDTRVYWGHEYTVENLEFALTLLPGDPPLVAALTRARLARSQCGFTVPTTIGQERCTNVFLGADRPEVKAAVSLPQADPAEVFAELRRRKDLF